MTEGSAPSPSVPAEQPTFAVADGGEHAPSRDLNDRVEIGDPMVFWTALVAIGVLAGLTGGVLMRLLYAVQHLAWREGAEGLYAAVLHSTLERKLVALLLAGLLVAAGRAALRLPKGGHSADLIEALWFGDGRMPAWRTLVRAVLSIVVVGLGGAVGREGALKQAGEVAGWQVAHRLRLDAGQRRILAACGAGAGMAAAYDIPLGGALFALEVLLGTASRTVAVAAFGCSTLAVAASWLLLPMEPVYATPTYTLSAGLVVFAAVSGPLVGLAAAAYVRLIGWTDRGEPRTQVGLVAWPLAVFLLLALAAQAWPELVGNGKDVVEIAFQGGAGDPRLGTLATVVGLVVARAIATAACLKTGTPGGLFTPTITCGALLGQAMGLCWQRIAPGDPPGACSVIGGAALLAAASGGPLSAVASVIELGHHIDGIIVPIMLASAGACFVMRALGSPSIYTVRLWGKCPGARPQPVES